MEVTGGIWIGAFATTSLVIMLRTWTLSGGGNGMEVTGGISIEAIAILLSVGVLSWQIWLNTREMRKAAVRNIYDRYLEITKMEVQYPELHRMFMGRDAFAELSTLGEQEVRTRALSMFVFDQFALIMNLGERPSLYTRVDPVVSRLLVIPFLRTWWKGVVDRNRTLFDINKDYIEEVMTNPLVTRCWKDWRLGQTWKGSEFFDYINNIVTEADKHSKQAEPAQGNSLREEK